MKLNSKLWMLAVALATVGCQDDLDNSGTGTNQGNGLEGETAKITVAVNTGITTRAETAGESDLPTPGEEGDGDEAGTIDESRVNDVTIFLYQNMEGDDVSTNYEFKSDSKILAAGFATTDGQMDAGTPEHSFYKEVEVTVTDKVNTLIGEKVGVIAVTNLTEDGSDALISYVVDDEASDKNTGARLADFLQKTYKTNAGFVMSTHTIGGGTTGLEESTVTLRATQGSEPAPEVSVYVERVAAKVRINEYEGNNFVYTVTHDDLLVDNKPVEDVVILNDVAIVNQLNSGSYLIKRVTDAVTGESADLNMTATDAANDDYLYLELGNATDAATNFVIDPWTRLKTKIADGANANDIFNGTEQLTYANRFIYLEDDVYNYAKLWNTFQSSSSLHNAEDFILDGNQKRDLCYTMENTTSIAASQNGYSTGAVFKATYYPGAWGVAIDDETTTDPKDAKAKGYDLVKSDCIVKGTNGAADTYKAEDFYLYQGNVFKNREAIFAYILSKTVPDQLETGEDLSDYYRWCDFSNDNVLDADFSIADFKASHAASANDPFGYIAYLNRQGNDVAGNQILSFKGFIGSVGPDSNPNSVALNPESVTYYQNGDSYYPFWIRHANNGNPNEMGIMEFGIVRNNIYDMTVAGINGYGFVTPTPSTPDENPELRIAVVLYVKDWTLRKNGDIYL